MTEPAYVTRTRTSYDTVAVSYERALRDALDTSPWDRAVLGTFAELVGPTEPVADLGCGPGRITTHLAELGLDAFGIDLSPGMIEVANQTHPHLRFEVGSMSALNLPDATLAGAVAWYSIIHTPPERLPAVFAEIARVLRPNGVLALAFQVGDEQLHITQAYGHEVSADAYRLPPDTITALMADAGLAIQAQLERQPEPPEKTPQAYLIARKAGGGQPRHRPADQRDR
ncbi:MAG TPA: class I SAM-dependent methyltransferase [Pseudonocardiaceae bacterium]|nr:class I SAM-dependent methyltransferase [Pseudonocardiaceae bacterium]